MKNYSKIKNQAYKKYKSIGRVYCPYLKKEIVFNSKGFRHLIYKAGNKKRDQKSQILRFQLIDKAVKVLGITTTLQEYQSETTKIILKDHGRRVFKSKSLIYFSFIAIIQGWKIKVIVKRIRKGQPFFWSLIPNWKTRRKERIFFKGNMEED